MNTSRRWILSAVGASVLVLSLVGVTSPAGAATSVRAATVPFAAPVTNAVVQIAEGHATGCAVLRSTRVECWGLGDTGQLGQGSFDSTMRPVLVRGIVGAKEVAVGFGHSCALLDTGTVMCWGENNYGQLGDASLTTSPTPVRVRGVAHATQIALGFQQSCARLANGTARCWGWNTFGQLGDGNVSSEWTARPVARLRGVRQLSAAYANTCAIAAGGAVWCWGSNPGGEIGNGTTRYSLIPTRVLSLTHAVSVSAGFASACAAVADGRVFCWGENNFGQLGDGTTKRSLVPEVVRGVGGADEVVVGFGHACALIRSHTVRCWGWDGHGQLGTGGRTNRLVATPVRPLSGVTQLAAGDDSTCALLAIGLVTCWGWNVDGQLGDGSTAEVLRPNYIPSAPLAVHPVPGDASATVSWHRPQTQGIGLITTYVVVATNVRTHVRRACVWTAGPLQCVVDGLVNGQTYSFTVVARNVAGNGASSPPVTVLLVTVPGALPDVTATGVTGGGAATVRWDPPSYNGGYGITEYVVTAIDVTTRANGGQRCTAVPPVTTCTVTGLTNGDQYDFAVVAHNHLGNSAAAVSNPVIPQTHPFSPTGVGAVVANGQATVSWTPPTSDGGSPISGYTVTATDQTNAANGSETCAVTPPTTSCVVMGLTNGDTYVFTVIATNADGGSSASTPSAPVIPLGGPLAPTAVGAVAGAGEAAVSWTAPTSNGGSAITGYTATAIDGTTPANGGKTCSATPPTTNCVITGLTNGDSYTFTVYATNAVAMGPVSTPSSAVIPVAAPDPPTGVTATAGDGEATVSWTPGSAEGSTILSYQVTAVGDSSETCAATPPATSCTVTGLTNGDSYTFTVTASNAIGASTASTSSNAVTPSGSPGAPTGVNAVAGDQSAQVSWSAASSGGSSLTGYTVTATDQTNSGNGGESCQATPPTTQCTVGGLTDGDTYTFTVYATNGNGSGPSSSPSNAVTPSGGPGAPSSVSASAGDQSAQVSWNPASGRGSPIIGYTVTADDQTNSGNGGETCQATAPTTQCTVSGLANGDSYTFTVVATNGNGSGPSSSPSNAVTPDTVPDPPTDVTAAPLTQSALVGWDAPFDEGSAIAYYTVTASDSTTPSNGGETCQATAPSTQCTVPGLTTGDSYTFTVTATNGVGQGGASAPSNAVTPS